MTDTGQRLRLEQAIARLPTTDGGSAIVLATAGTPPAMALLSTGDVYIHGDRVSVVTYRGSSASQRLGGSFTLLVPGGDAAFRIEVVEAVTRSAGKIELIEGRLVAIRPTAEPPWLIEMSFRPDPPDDPSVGAFVEYWSRVRTWLQAGAIGEPPKPAL